MGEDEELACPAGKGREVTGEGEGCDDGNDATPSGAVVLGAFPIEAAAAAAT